MMGLHLFRFNDCFCLQQFCNQIFGPHCPAQGNFLKKKVVLFKNHHCQMGKAMKAMKASTSTGLVMKKGKANTKKNPAKGTSPDKGKGPAKGRAMRKPASALTLPKDEGLSLEEKIDAFHRKGSQDVNVFLDSLTQGQREALWGRFARARESLKDPQCDKMWNDHCKGKGSESKKKQLLEIFLKSKGDLKKNNLFHKELMSISEVHGNLAGSSA